MKKILLVFFVIITIPLYASTYYVATTGNDSNPGTIERPFATWQKGFNVAVAGDIVYIRGGTYYPRGVNGRNTYSGVFVSGKNGTSSNPINIWAYPGETPVLDCSNITQTGSRMGIYLYDADYWYLKGLSITRVQQHSSGSYTSNGIRIYNSNHNKLELIKSYSNGGSGIAVVYESEGNYILNCDSYYNYDRYNSGDNADGIEISFIVERSGNERVNTIRGCRAWDNSDDGFDHYKCEGSLIIDRCWTWHNGVVPGTDTPIGDGNGFKLGGTFGTTESTFQRTLTNCIAFNHRQNGFSQQSAKVKMIFYNNTSYKNGGYGYEFVDYNMADIIRNNISFSDNASTCYRSNQTSDHNSWQNGLSVTRDDFVSLDATQLMKPRKSDGSLPDITFLNLASGSDLINKGVNVGLTFNGSAPDLGAFESGSAPLAPTIPLIVSSGVENSSPSVIEITYNLSLASIVPATSAFSVQVNSSARTINSIAVSGTKVLLTLSSPVAYGNSVTVSYTAPSSNALQTPENGKAESFSSISVTNRVNPPPSPVFTGAVVENSAPSVITMTYSLSLANIVPSASAFLVTVNSSARTVTAVAVAGTKVSLTLSSPVVYGNNVTVAYTKPSSKPLQTSAGGQAASISAQRVTNNVNEVPKAPEVINTPPSVVVNYNPGTYSGFVGTINAGGSYDANKDNLTYTWKVPGNIPVSATNRPTINFLAPIVDASQTYTFTLTVSDGKAPQTKTVPVTIIPYKPNFEIAEIVKVEAADLQSVNDPYNVADGNLKTIWSGLGDDQWIILELDGSFDIDHVMLAFQPGQRKEFYFDLLGSNDKVNWEPVLTKSKSCAFSADLQVFEFPATKAEKEFRYIKLVGHGNSADEWNHIAEIRIFGFRHKNPTDYEDQIVKIYPNPARELVNVLIDEQTFMPDFIKIVSLTGKILYSDKIDPDIKQFQIPLDFRQGIYVIQMGSGDITMFTQKLIVAD